MILKTSNFTFMPPDNFSEIPEFYNFSLKTRDDSGWFYENLKFALQTNNDFS